MSVYEAISEKFNLTPNEGEGEQDFYLRVLKETDDVSEDDFGELPEDVQDWIEEGVKAVAAKRPIQMMTGCPLANGHDTAEAEAEAKPKAKASAGKGKAADKGGKKTAAKPAEKGKDKAAAPAKTE